MKNIRLLWISCLLLLRVTCNADPVAGGSKRVEHSDTRRKNTFRTLAAYPTVTVRLGGPALNNVRHHGPNQAVVGGATNSKGNASAINGTGMKRKP
jgi:hypothetical protein